MHEVRRCQLREILKGWEKWASAFRACSGFLRAQLSGWVSIHKWILHAKYQRFWLHKIKSKRGGGWWRWNWKKSQSTILHQHSFYYCSCYWNALTNTPMYFLSPLELYLLYKNSLSKKNHSSTKHPSKPYYINHQQCHNFLNIRIIILHTHLSVKAAMICIFSTHTPNSQKIRSFLHFPATTTPPGVYKHLPSIFPRTYI